MNDIQVWISIYSAWPDIVFAMLLSMVSGIAAHMHRLFTHRPRLFSIYEFIADVLSSCLAGFIVIMIGAHLVSTGTIQRSPFAIGALVPLVGWGAPRFIDMLNKQLIKRTKITFGDGDDQT